MTSFYSENELAYLGLKSYGNNVLISKKSSIYGANNIEIGNNVRIDDFCILSGNIKIGDYVHIAAATLLYGGEDGIILKDFSCLSSRCAVYAISDDYSGNFMTNSTVPNKYKNVISKKTIIGKHVVVGTGSTVLPGVEIIDGASIGAMSLINKSLNEVGIYVGIPAKKIKKRQTEFLRMEIDLKNKR